MTTGLLVTTSKLSEINPSHFPPIKLAKVNYLMMRSKKMRKCLMRQERKNTQLQNQDERLFYGLGSLIRVLVAGTERQLSDILSGRLLAVLVIQEFIVTQACSLHGKKKNRHPFWSQLPPRSYQVKSLTEYMNNQNLLSSPHPSEK